MYFKSVCRTNPTTKKLDGYYRLVESYRNSLGRVCHRNLLTIGFFEQEPSPEQLNAISRHLTDRYQHKQGIFPITDPVVSLWVAELWGRLVGEQRIDHTIYDKNSRMVNVDTIEHNDVREIGAEWLCYNTWKELGIDNVLHDNGFTESEIRLAQTQIIGRAVFHGSELSTTKWMKENSAITEITGFDVEKINKDRLYRGALKLNSIKNELEQHLSTKTNELFDIQDKIVLYDLTNTYFEGEKRNSSLARFGRSKEKRSDCRLVVLALVVNIYGFIKHSSIHEGNFSDSKGLEEIIAGLDQNIQSNRPLVVMDAGIATKENLEMILSKGYHYLCVSRSQLKHYKFDNDRQETSLKTKSGQEIKLRKILTEQDTDYCIEVSSKKKALKERGMKSQFETRFQAELEKIKVSLSKKGGVKQADKVNQRIGRAKQKYPSIQAKYDIKLQYDPDNKKVEAMSWSLNENKEQQQKDGLGKYLIKTSMDMGEEQTVWRVYNTIREIESTFRSLKTELKIRPVFHQKDLATVAHLNLALLAYTLANTVRQKLKKHKINDSWTEILRIANTQKIITTTGINKAGEHVIVRKCSKPEEKLAMIQRALNIKNKPFTKQKSVVLKHNLKKSLHNVYEAFTPS